MSHPIPIADPVKAHVRVLEAERLRRAPELTPQEQVEADLRELIAVVAAAYTTPPDSEREAS